MLLCRVRVFSDFKHASPEQRARLLAWWGQRILAARGVEAMIGWHTEKTDAKLAEMIDTVNPGEYRRVCSLLEKAIYGGIALKVYEERAVYSLLDRLYTRPGARFRDRTAAALSAARSAGARESGKDGIKSALRQKAAVRSFSLLGMWKKWLKSGCVFGK